MPVYDHLCSDDDCNEIFEVYCPIADRKQFAMCPKCGSPAERIISSRVERQEPTWLDDAKRQMHPDARASIRDRNDLQRHMRREGIDQIG